MVEFDYINMFTDEKLEIKWMNKIYDFNIEGYVSTRINLQYKNPENTSYFKSLEEYKNGKNNKVYMEFHG